MSLESVSILARTWLRRSSLMERICGLLTVLISCSHCWRCSLARPFIASARERRSAARLFVLLISLENLSNAGRRLAWGVLTSWSRELVMVSSCFVAVTRPSRVFLRPATTFAIRSGPADEHPATSIAPRENAKKERMPASRMDMGGSLTVTRPAAPVLDGKFLSFLPEVVVTGGQDRNKGRARQRPGFWRQRRALSALAPSFPPRRQFRDSR